MRFNIVLILGVLFLVSTSLNVYLYIEKNHWQEAWLNQFITTSEVESIFKQAADDTTIENVKIIAIREFGEGNVHIIDLQGEFKDYESDDVALGVNDTLLFFKDGYYYGSKAYLPNR